MSFTYIGAFVCCVCACVHCMAAVHVLISGARSRHAPTDTRTHKRRNDENDTTFATCATKIRFSIFRFSFSFFLSFFCLPLESLFVVILCDLRWYDVRGFCREERIGSPEKETTKKLCVHGRRKTQQ